MDWIKCSDRMPPTATGVIVATPWQSTPGGYAMKWPLTVLGILMQMRMDGLSLVHRGSQLTGTHYLNHQPHDATDS